LRKQFNTGLKMLRENGIYDAIYAKWFSEIQF
jgi:ABC-type amino acid transport substrate-binding protein